MSSASGRTATGPNVALWLGVSVAALGALVFCGWVFDIAALKFIVPGLQPMRPNTAIGFMVSGIATAALARAPAATPPRAGVAAAALAVLALGALSLVEEFVGIDFGIDHGFIAQLASAPARQIRMSPPTAFCLVLAGIALGAPALPATVRPRLHFVGALGAVLALIGGLALVGHLLDTLLGIGFLNFSRIAITSATALVLLGGAFVSLFRRDEASAWELDRVTTGGFVIGVLAMVTMAAWSYGLTRELQGDAARIGKTEETLKQIEALKGDLAEYADSRRSYVFVGDERLLESGVGKPADIRRDLGALRALTADRTSQRRRLDRLEPLIGEWSGFVEQVVSTRRQAGFPAAQSLIATGEGSRLREAMQSVLGELRDAEYATLEHSRAQMEATSGRTFLLLPVAVFLSLAILSLGMFRLNAGTAERRRSQQTLLESERRFSEMLGNVELASVMVDRENRIIYCNDHFLRLTGWARAELLGRNWIERVVPPGAEASRREIHAAMLAGEHAARHHTSDIVTRSGELRLIRWSNSTLRSATGEVTGTASIGEDVTERMQTARAHLRLAAIVESSDDAIIGTDLDGTVTNWNHGAQRIFGYAPAEIVGASITCLLPDDRRDEEDRILGQIRRGETVLHLETQRKCRDGRLIDVLVTASPIRDEAGTVIGASKIAHDTTATRQLEQQVRHGQKMEAIGQLTGGVAHDFNNLLGVILGNVDLLAERIEGDPTALGYARAAQNAALRGADLTKRLLGFSSRQQLSPAPTAIDENIRSMLALASRVLGPDIAMTTSLDPDIPPVHLDAIGFDNALLNLAVNARDAMPDGGALRISTTIAHLEDTYPPVQAEEIRPGPYARIDVSDTGSGMSPEVLARAQEPFFTTKPRGKGTGLGLSMVYGFVKQSGGCVRLYSEEGRGTTVSLFLPLGDAYRGTPSAVAGEADPEPLRPESGLVALAVDDQADLLDVAIAYLEQMGFERILRAADGESALAALAGEPRLDLLVTDIIMPGGMNGVELARRVRARYPDVRIVHSSGYPSDALAGKSGLAVDGPLLRKPYQRREFVAAIARCLRGVDAGPDAAGRADSQPSTTVA